jgi:outer membrane protein TolC
VIQKAASVSSEASWKRKENYSGFLPTLSGNLTYFFDKKLALTNIRLGNSPTETIVPQIIPTSQLSLVSTYPLFEGFQNLNRYNAAAENESATTNELSWNRFKIEMDVTLAFYKAVAGKILKDVAEQNLKVLQDHLKEVRLFKNSGMATNYDVLRVEVQVSNAETDLLNAIDNIAINEQNLFEILGVDKTSLQLNGELPVLNENLLNGLSVSDIQLRSDIKALTHRVSALSYSDKAQNAYWIPRLSLLGQYQYYNNLNTSFSDTDKYRSAYQVGLQLNWNIFDGLVSFSKSRETTEQLVQAEKSFRITELKAQKDFEIAKRKFNFHLNLFKARNNDITKSKESVRLAREGRRVGARTNSDLLDAEADLYKSQAGAVNAQLGAVEALINLQTSIGRKI